MEILRQKIRPIAEAAQKHGALLIAVFTEVVSLGAVVPPGAQDADIVVGEGQSLGVGLQFGGLLGGIVRELAMAVAAQDEDLIRLKDGPSAGVPPAAPAPRSTLFAAECPAMPVRPPYSWPGRIAAAPRRYAIPRTV